MQLKTIMLTEISQTQKHKSCILNSYKNIIYESEINILKFDNHLQSAYTLEG